MTQKAYKYRFYPTSEQVLLLIRTMGCTRLVYNRALAFRTEANVRPDNQSVEGQLRNPRKGKKQKPKL